MVPLTVDVNYCQSGSARFRRVLDLLQPIFVGNDFRLGLTSNGRRPLLQWFGDRWVMTDSPRRFGFSSIHGHQRVFRTDDLQCRHGHGWFWLFDRQQSGNHANGSETLRAFRSSTQSHATAVTVSHAVNSVLVIRELVFQVIQQLLKKCNIINGSSWCSAAKLTRVPYMRIQFEICGEIGSSRQTVRSFTGPKRLG